MKGFLAGGFCAHRARGARRRIPRTHPSLYLSPMTPVRRPLLSLLLTFLPPPSFRHPLPPSILLPLAEYGTGRKKRLARICHMASPMERLYSLCRLRILIRTSPPPNSKTLTAHLDPRYNSPSFRDLRDDGTSWHLARSRARARLSTERKKPSPLPPVGFLPVSQRLPFTRSTPESFCVLPRI